MCDRFIDLKSNLKSSHCQSQLISSQAPVPLITLHSTAWGCPHLTSLHGLQVSERGDSRDDPLGGRVTEGHVEGNMAILVPGGASRGSRSVIKLSVENVKQSCETHVSSLRVNINERTDPTQPWLVFR